MPDKLYKYRNYKDFLNQHLHAKDSPRGMQSKLARHLTCQSSYLYQVLKGKAELTEDQAFKTTTFFNFGEAERGYFLTLVRYAKASSPELKDFLKSEIQRLREEELNLKNQVDAVVARSEEEVWDYYLSSSLPSLIHFLTSSPKYQSAEAISKKLQIPLKEAQSHLQRLARYEFVQLRDKQWCFSSPSIHLPKDSKYGLLAQTLRRSQVLASVLRAPAEAVHFSSLFTLDKESYDQLRHMISDFVQKAQAVIHAGGSDELYVLAVDLFDGNIR